MSSSSQNVIVLRHGHRLDNFDPLWLETTSRPWDPPLAEAGLARAYETGRMFKSKLKFPIHRVFVSPFVRCVQTASQVVSALSADDIKVGVEYGLCEMLNKQAIWIQNAPKDGNFGFNLSEIEALLPAGTVDHTFERVYEELPKWGETVLGARTRYQHVLKELADKYPSENLLLVTHGEGVVVSVSSILKGVKVSEVDYCAFLELKRSIVKEDQSYKHGDFEVVDHPGIKYYYPTNGIVIKNFGFNLSEIEALLPAGTVDHTFERVYEELPKWGETVLGARTRYQHVLKALADKYPSENLLLVTHGEGVVVSVSSILKGVKVSEVDYCAYLELKRSIVNEDQSYKHGDFEVVDHPGVKYYYPTNGTVGDGE